MSAVAWMILINVAVFVVDFLFNDLLKDHLALEGRVFTEPWKLWQLLTYGFVHGSFMHIAFNMLGLYWFGRDIEIIHGRRKFLQFYLSTIILSGVVWVAFSHFFDDKPLVEVVGASGGVTGLLIASVLHDPRRTLLFWGVPVPAWAIAIITVAADVSRMLGAAAGVPDPSNVAYSAHLGGALFGFIFYTSGWTLATPLPTQFSLGGIKRKVRGPRLKVHRPVETSTYDPDDEGDADGNLESQVDAILAKISASGQDSLTRKEKKILEAASRRAKERKRHGINN